MTQISQSENCDTEEGQCKQRGQDRQRLSHTGTSTPRTLGVQWTRAGKFGVRTFGHEWHVLKAVEAQRPLSAMTAGNPEESLLQCNAARSLWRPLLPVAFSSHPGGKNPCLPHQGAPCSLRLQFPSWQPVPMWWSPKPVTICLPAHPGYCLSPQAKGSPGTWHHGAPNPYTLATTKLLSVSVNFRVLLKYILFFSGFVFSFSVLIIAFVFSTLFLKGLNCCTSWSLAMLIPHLSVHSFMMA